MNQPSDNPNPGERPHFYPEAGTRRTGSIMPKPAEVLHARQRIASAYDPELFAHLVDETYSRGRLLYEPGKRALIEKMISRCSLELRITLMHLLARPLVLVFILLSATASVSYCAETIVMEAKSATAHRNMTVYGQAPVGAFGIELLDHVEGAAKLGMNLIFSYSPETARKQLDLADPMGMAVSKHEMQVLYPLCGRFTRVRLAREIKPTDTTIPVTSEQRGSNAVVEFPESGYLMIEGERIEYAERTAEAFTGCRRGTEGTKAAAHGINLLLCNSEALRKEVLAVKDAPGLWGYWLVDDHRPREIDCLREMSRIIRLTDKDPPRRHNSHVILMSGSVEIFDAGIADALGIYPYPYHMDKLNAEHRNEVRVAMTHARNLQPDIGLIGIYQAFAYNTNPEWKIMPSAEHVREDMLSFYNWGADGVMAYTYHSDNQSSGNEGFDLHPEVCDMIARTYQEILAGKIKRTVPRVSNGEWLSVCTGSKAIPSPNGTQLYNLDDQSKLAALVNQNPTYYSAAPFSADGRSYPLRLSFAAGNKSDPESNRRASAEFSAGDLTSTDWSQAAAIEQPIYNQGENTVVLSLTLQDDAGGEWHRTADIPPRVPVLVRVPMDEVRLSANPARIQHWMLSGTKLSQAVELRLGTPMLAPLSDPMRR